MTGGGAPGAAGIIRCLKEDDAITLTVADANEDAAGRLLHSDFVKIPRGEAADFIAVLLQACETRGVNVIMPLVTKELFALAKHRAVFEDRGIRLLVSSEPAIATANNKVASYSFLQSKGIPVPRFFKVNTSEEFIHAAFELGHPAKPFCFKPAVSNGSRGFRIVSDSLNESEMLFLEKPYNTSITYAHALKILSSQSFPELLVSEYLPGEEYSVDCLANHGEPVLVVPRLREKMINGISVQGRFVNEEGIIDYCSRIIRAIGLHGNIGIQVKQSESGIPLLLEINPRVQGTIVAGLGAGVNLPLEAVRQEAGLSPGASQESIRWGTRFFRYWTEVYE